MSSLLLRVQTLSVAFALAASAWAQGIETKSGAQILFGSAANCSKPATIDVDKVRKATPEWRTIKADGVPRSSARYDLLVAEMNQRIQSACKDVAQGGGHDCVLSKCDLADAKGLKVTDITDEVVRKLES
jgi:hypothetical protein